MKKRLTKADSVAWKKAMARYEATRKAFEELEASTDTGQRDEALEQFYVAENALISLRAPTSAAVFEKLMILFVGDLWSEAEKKVQQVSIVRDIWRLHQAGKIKMISTVPQVFGD